MNNTATPERRHTPALSVIVPVYNSEKYLRECLDSIRRQSLTDMEIILVDDCSTDKSPEICDEYARADSRFKVFHLPENRGPGIARNVALDFADGDYCTFVDSDDKIHPNAYKEMYDFARRNALDIVRCEMGGFSDDDAIPKPLFQQYKRETIYTRKKDLRNIALCVFSSPVSPEKSDMNFGGSACSAIHHRSLFENGGVRFARQPHMISEDFIFEYDCLQNAKSIGLLPRRYYYYRRNLQSRSNIPKDDILQRALNTAEIIERMIMRDGYEETDLEHAYLYTINITRAFIKNFFLSTLPVKTVKRWFLSQHDSPILERAYKNRCVKFLPFTHRLNFELFYKKKFYALYALVKGRELIR